MVIDDKVAFVLMKLTHLAVQRDREAYLRGLIDLCAQATDADVIVFGHTHRAFAKTLGRTMLFNPGGVHQWNPETAKKRLTQNPGWFEWCWLQVARHMRNHAAPSVGILEVGAASIVPTVIEL